MSSVKSISATGTAYSYDGMEELLVFSPYGVLVFDSESEVCLRELSPSEVDRLGERDIVDEEFEFDLYVVRDWMFAPRGLADSVGLNEYYIVDGEELVRTGGIEIVDSELVGVGSGGDEVIEVYSGTIPVIKANEEIDRDPKLVWRDAVERTFNEQHVERVSLIR